MDYKAYLLNLGFFYSVIIPEEKKCYILNGKDFEHEDVQNFISNKPMNFSNYENFTFPYDDGDSWTSYMEAADPVTYHAKKDLLEPKFFDYLTEKKYTDGFLLAIKDPEKNKVKVFKKNMNLLNK